MITFSNKHIIVFTLIIIAVTYLLVPNQERTGLLLYKAHQTKISKKIFLKLLKSKPDDIAALKHLREIYIAEGKTKEALLIQKKLVHIKPKISHYINKLSVLYDWNNDSYHKLTTKEKLLEFKNLSNKDREKIIIELANGYRYSKKFNDANRMFLLLEKYPSVKNIFTMIDYYLSTKQAKKSISLLLQIVKKSTIYNFERSKLANLLEYTHKYQSALNQYLIIFGEDKNFYKNLNNANFLSLKNSKTLLQKNAATMNKIILMLTRLDKTTLLNTVYKKIILLDPTNYKYYVNYIHFKINTKQDPLAIIYKLENQINRHKIKNRILMLRKVMELYAEINSLEDIIRIAKVIESKNPRDINLLEFIAQTFEQLSMHKNAIEYYSKIYKLINHTNNKNYKNNKSSFVKYKKRLIRSIASTKEVMQASTDTRDSNTYKKSPKNLKYYNNNYKEKILLKILDLYDASGKTLQTINILKKLIKLAPLKIKYKKKLAIRYMWINKNDLAFKLFKEVEQFKITHDLKIFDNTELDLAILYFQKDKFKISLKYLTSYNGRKSFETEFLRSNLFFKIKLKNKLKISLKQLAKYKRNKKRNKDYFNFMTNFYISDKQYNKGLENLEKLFTYISKENEDDILFYFESKLTILTNLNKQKSSKDKAIFCNNNLQLFSKKLYQNSLINYFTLIRSCTNNLNRQKLYQTFFTKFPNNQVFRLDYIYFLIDHKQYKYALDLIYKFSKDTLFVFKQKDKTIKELQKILLDKKNIKKFFFNSDYTYYKVQNFFYNDINQDIQFNLNQKVRLGVNYNHTTIHSSLLLNFNSFMPYFIKQYPKLSLRTKYGLKIYKNNPDYKTFPLYFELSTSHNTFYLSYTFDKYKKLFDTGLMLDNKLQESSNSIYFEYYKIQNILFIIGSSYNLIKNKTLSSQTFTLDAGVSFLNIAGSNFQAKLLWEINNLLTSDSPTLLNIYGRRSTPCYLGLKYIFKYQNFSITPNIHLGGDTERKLNFLNANSYELAIKYERQKLYSIFFLFDYNTEALYNVYTSSQLFKLNLKIWL